jgi:hypothetical protein
VAQQLAAELVVAHQHDDRGGDARLGEQLADGHREVQAVTAVEALTARGEVVANGLAERVQRAVAQPA